MESPFKGILTFKEILTFRLILTFKETFNKIFIYSLCNTFVCFVFRSKISFQYQATMQPVHFYYWVDLMALFIMLVGP